MAWEWAYREVRVRREASPWKVSLSYPSCQLGMQLPLMDIVLKVVYHKPHVCSIQEFCSAAQCSSGDDLEGVHNSSCNFPVGGASLRYNNVSGWRHFVVSCLQNSCMQTELQFAAGLSVLWNWSMCWNLKWPEWLQVHRWQWLIIRDQLCHPPSPVAN